MFGNYSRTLDVKNRVMIPAKIREALGDVCYITLGPDGVLEIRDAVSFDLFRSKLLAPNMLNANMRKFARLLLGNSLEIEVDKTGRMGLPEHFLQKAAITKDVTFVGVGNKVELWPTAAFERFQNEFAGENSLDDLAQKLLKDGVEL